MDEKKQQEPVATDERLECILSDDERKVKMKVMLFTLDRLDELEEELKDLKARHKAKAAEAEAAARDLRKILRGGRETREVRCLTSPDWEERKLVTIRTDTGAVVRSRPMTAAELQGKLALVSPDKPPAGFEGDLAKALDEEASKDAEAFSGAPAEPSRAADVGNASSKVATAGKAPRKRRAKAAAPSAGA